MYPSKQTAEWAGVAVGRADAVPKLFGLVHVTSPMIVVKWISWYLRRFVQVNFLCRAVLHYVHYQPGWIGIKRGQRLGWNPTQRTTPQTNKPRKYQYFSLGEQCPLVSLDMSDSKFLANTFQKGESSHMANHSPVDTPSWDSSTRQSRWTAWCMLTVERSAAVQPGIL